MNVRFVCVSVDTHAAHKTHTLPRILTLSPEAEAPLSSGDLAIPVGVTGIEEGSDADLILVQVDGCQLSLVQVQVAIGVQLGKHPAYGVLTAGHQAPVQHCKHKEKQTIVHFIRGQLRKWKMKSWLVCLEISADSSARTRPLILLFYVTTFNKKINVFLLSSTYYKNSTLQSLQSGLDLLLIRLTRA